jgi:DNA-directed RNA polymerase alpha subunit
MERKLNLEEFGFSPRIIHVLNRNKINKDKLITITYMELASLRTVGPDKIEEIQKALEAKGYFNIQLPNIRYATKATKAEYKNKLVEELLKLVIYWLRFASTGFLFRFCRKCKPSL